MELEIVLAVAVERLSTSCVPLKEFFYADTHMDDRETFAAAQICSNTLFKRPPPTLSVSEYSWYFYNTIDIMHKIR